MLKLRFLIYPSTNPTGLSGPNKQQPPFVTEQTGTIKVFNNSQNTSSTSTFLDITNQVLYGGEQGLLSA